MPRYSVHARSRQAETIRSEADRVRFVKEGFSWWGFFFPVPWLLVKAMWEVLALTIIVLIGIFALGSALGVPDLALMALSFGVNLIIGFEGNDLYRWTLSRRGLHEAGPASGADREEAELRFFLALPEASIPAPATISLTGRPEAHDALGLFQPAGPSR